MHVHVHVRMRVRVRVRVRVHVHVRVRVHLRVHAHVHVWPASAAQAAGSPRRAGAWGTLRRGLALKAALGEPAGRGPSRLAFDNTGRAEAWRRV